MNFFFNCLLFLMDLKNQLLRDYFNDYNAFLYSYLKGYNDIRIYYKLYKNYILYNTCNNKLIVDRNTFKVYYEEFIGNKRYLDKLIWDNIWRSDKISALKNNLATST